MKPPVVVPAEVVPPFLRDYGFVAVFRLGVLAL